MRHVLESPWSEEATVKAFGFGLSVLLELLLQVVVQRRRKPSPDELSAGRLRRAPRRRGKSTSRRLSRRGRIEELRRVKRRFAPQAGPVCPGRQRVVTAKRLRQHRNRPGNRSS
ncbi:hypothetical protein [Kitasatospora sp. NPDC048407]|uniref:hypothetical protein n=1 Tax=Kitasatospora sp. NPDC048407 TaxID=3364051 RepID=UPI00371F2A9A